MDAPKSWEVLGSEYLSRKPYMTLRRDRVRLPNGAVTLWTFVGDRVLRGKEAVRKWMAESYTSPPEVTVDHLISEGEFLTAVGTVTMAGKDEKKERFEYSDVWRIRDGKLAELRAFVIKQE